MELFLLVLRNLLARPVRSLLTLLGVLVATGSMVLFLSFGEGLRRALFQELSRVGPAIQVVPEGAEGFVFGALPEIPPETLKALEEAGKALGVRAVVPTLFLTRGGFDPSTSFFFQGLPEGTPPDLLYPGLEAKEGRLTPSEKGAVVGAKVAERSGLALGSVLRLTPRLELRVEGVLEATGGLADNLIFIPLRAIQEALGTENVTAVLVALSPGQKAEAVARALEEAVFGVKAQTTSEVMRFAERALRISDLVRFGISLVALVVGGLLVANTVTICQAASPAGSSNGWPWPGLWPWTPPSSSPTSPRGTWTWRHGSRWRTFSSPWARRTPWSSSPTTWSSRKGRGASSI